MKIQNKKVCAAGLGWMDMVFALIDDEKLRIYDIGDFCKIATTTTLIDKNNSNNTNPNNKMTVEQH